MQNKKLGYDEAYSLKTPQDSKKLYKKWARTYDKDFALNSNYISPKKISVLFNKYAKMTDTPILDVGAGTGLVGEFLNKKRNKEIIGIDISSEIKINSRFFLKDPKFPNIIFFHGNAETANDYDDISIIYNNSGFNLRFG